MTLKGILRDQSEMNVTAVDIKMAIQTAKSTLRAPKLDRYKKSLIM